MTGEGFYKLWTDPEFSAYVYKIARKHSRNKEDIQDFKQQAALKVDEKCQDDCSMEMAKKIAFRAIHAEYMKIWRRRNINISI